MTVYKFHLIGHILKYDNYYLYILCAKLNPFQFLLEGFTYPALCMGTQPEPRNGRRPLKTITVIQTWACYTMGQSYCQAPLVRKVQYMDLPDFISLKYCTRTADSKPQGQTGTSRSYLERSSQQEGGWLMMTQQDLASQSGQRISWPLKPLGASCCDGTRILVSQQQLLKLLCAPLMLGMGEETERRGHIVHIIQCGEGGRQENRSW